MSEAIACNTQDAGEVSARTPDVICEQYCTMHSSCTYQGPPLCPIHLCSPKKVSILWQACDGFQKSSVIFIVGSLIAEVLFKQLLIRTTV